MEDKAKIGVKYSGYTKPGTKQARIVARIFIIVGILLMLIAAAVTWSLHSSAKGYEKTYGTIVGFNSDDYPVIEYTVGGETYRITANASSTSYSLNSRHEVVYDPAHPEKGKLGGVGYYLVPMIIGGLGLLLFLIGIIVNAVNKSVREDYIEAKANDPDSVSVKRTGVGEYEVNIGRAPPAPASAPAAQSAGGSEPKYCHICGYKLHSGSGFCGNCGAKIK